MGNLRDVCQSEVRGLMNRWGVPTWYTSFPVEITLQIATLVILEMKIS